MYVCMYVCMYVYAYMHKLARNQDTTTCQRPQRSLGKIRFGLRVPTFCSDLYRIWGGILRNARGS